MKSIYLILTILELEFQNFIFFYYILYKGIFIFFNNIY
jgi:hypothetical protein